MRFKFISSDAFAWKSFRFPQQIFADQYDFDNGRGVLALKFIAQRYLFKNFLSP
jgi:hypothetical protein